ncbi:DnaD domain protein [Bacillus sp. FSL R5-0394]
MPWHWKEVLPVDQYTVRLADVITDMDNHVLTLLYQPLIGTEAVGLYNSLRSQLPSGKYQGDIHTHHQLSVLLDLSLPKLLEARKKLEAIDLLRTYRKKTDDVRFFMYELQPPMKPHRFFRDDVLSVFLYNRLGKQGYRAVRERFALPVLDSSEFEEVTESFSNVFASLTHSEMQPALMNEQDGALKGAKGEALIGKDSDGLRIDDFDVELMKQALSSFIVPPEVLTDRLIDLIKKLAFVYQVEPLTMANLVEQASRGDMLDEDDLRKTIKEWYRLENGTKPPALGLKTQPQTARTMTKEPQTEEERSIQFYEQTPPMTLLEMRQEGAAVSPADARLIEELIVDYKLHPGVANVLIDYVLFQHDMKLSRGFMLKIAGHWKRKKVKTVPGAMGLVKEDKQKQANASPRQTYKRNPRQDKLPKWLMAEQEKGNSQESKQASGVAEATESKTSASQTESKKRIAALMEERKRLREKKDEGEWNQ